MVKTMQPLSNSRPDNINIRFQEKEFDKQEKITSVSKVIKESTPSTEKKSLAGGKVTLAPVRSISTPPADGFSPLGEQIEFYKKLYHTYGEREIDPYHTHIPELGNFFLSNVGILEEKFKNSEKSAAKTEMGLQGLQLLKAEVDMCFDSSDFTLNMFMQANIKLANIVTIFQAEGDIANWHLDHGNAKLIYDPNEDVMIFDFFTKPTGDRKSFPIIIYNDGNEGLSIKSFLEEHFGEFSGELIECKISPFQHQINSGKSGSKKDPHYSIYNTPLDFMKHDIYHSIYSWHLLELIGEKCGINVEKELSDMYEKAKLLYQKGDEDSLQKSKVLEAAAFILFHEIVGIISHNSEVFLENPLPSCQPNDRICEFRNMVLEDFETRLSPQASFDDFLATIRTIMTSSKAFGKRDEEYKITLRDLEGIIKEMGVFLPTSMHGLTERRKMEIVRRGFGNFWNAVREIRKTPI